MHKSNMSFCRIEQIRFQVGKILLLVGVTSFLSIVLINFHIPEWPYSITSFTCYLFSMSIYPSNENILSIYRIVQDAKLSMTPKRVMLMTTKFISYGNLQERNTGFLRIVPQEHVCASTGNTQQRTP